MTDENSSEEKVIRSESGVSRTGLLRRLTPWCAAGIVLLTALSFGLYAWLSSASFENRVRLKLIETLEHATGGRVELTCVHWNLWHLAAEADGITIHGLEAATETPYAHIDHIAAQVRILQIFSPHILLSSLDIVRPTFHLIVYPDGSTNQPHPRVTRKSSGRPVLDTLFDLKAGRVVVEQGVILFQNQRIPLDLSAEDVHAAVHYVGAANVIDEAYSIECGVNQLTFSRGRIQPVEGSIEAVASLKHHAARLESLRITSGGHTLNAQGILNNFANPQWTADLHGEIPLSLVGPLSGFDHLKGGIAQLSGHGSGQGSEFTSETDLRVADAFYEGDGFHMKGIRLTGHAQATSNLIGISNLHVQLNPSGAVDGSFLLDHWLKSTQEAHRRGLIDVRLAGIALDTIMTSVAPRKYQQLGLYTFANGPAKVQWTTAADLTVEAKLNLATGQNIPAGETPLTGNVDATYFEKGGNVVVRSLNVSTPQSTATASGRLGVYPDTQASELAIDARSMDVGEFDTLFRTLGLQRKGRVGAAALPAHIAGGEASFHGSLRGPIVDPGVDGVLHATNIALELPDVDIKDNGQKAPQSIIFDAVDGDGSYDPSHIVIRHGMVTHGAMQIALSGEIDAHAIRPRPSFDEESSIHGKATLTHVSLQDIAPVLQQFGVPALPVTGIMDASFEGNGTLKNLLGTGSLTLTGGLIYGEPYKSLHSQLAISGQDLRATSFQFQQNGGQILGSGSYNYAHRSFHVDARGSGFELSHFEWMRENSSAVGGKLAFTLTGSGTVDEPKVELHANLDQFAISGETVGALQLDAHTAQRAVFYDVTSHLKDAAFSAHGQTSLATPYQTQAQLQFSQVHITKLLQLARLQAVSAHVASQSALAGTLSVAGPLADPKHMSGEANLSQISAAIEGVHLHSEGAAHAVLLNGLLRLDPLHITGDDTNLNIRGSLSIFGKQQLDLVSNGSFNLGLAQTLDSDITANGETDFQIEAHGTLSNPGLRGQIHLKNASMNFGELPNGLSQVNGTLEFNQNRLEVRQLTAISGGGQVNTSGYLTYQHGLYADLTTKAAGIRIRYPQGFSSLANATMRLQGMQNNLLLSGNVLITRFVISSDIDMAALAAVASSSQTIAAPDSASNHIRLDIRVQSSSQLNFQNSLAKLTGDVDLHVLGTLATPSVLGRISITEGSATISGTKYELQRGDITFSNPVRIQPTFDIDATARVQDYDISLGVHGTTDKNNISYRSEPPLPQSDVIALLALGHTQDQQRIYSQQQQQTLGSSGTTDALLGGALNATVSSRVQKLFGGGSVRVDPDYIGSLGNATTRITVEEQVGPNLKLTFATIVNTTAEQFLQAEYSINRHVSLLVTRDESGVFSMVVKARRRYR